MTQHNLMITPKTKVGELLEAYPALEEVLIEISPVFAKLKNPVLRRTVAKVATLQQAAIIGNMPVEDLVSRLRSEIGQSIGSEAVEVAGYLSAEPPEWFSSEKIAGHFDATKMINAGESPMNEILHRVKSLNEGEIFELITPFVPAPIIEMILERKYKVWVENKDQRTSTYISIH